ncbi:hypothetical protein [Lyngbya sp. CCY1209]|uniref:hypothetical protein n=1 Tax=Lyngbya sp. CCY1209 TaxID=2886103 RepID=UPI002D209755|nr:hypothetical protein [Lyngbya sp. CCY1209]MEB3884156.1 hypothetical protein [Lyngbya sp. CCY1209]
MNTEISTKELTLDADGHGATFDVVVINDSDRMSSFQLEMSAAGVEFDRQSRWYAVTPEVCTKKPPGDQTEFRVKVLRSPIPGFVGLINLTVKVFSLELGSEDRHILRLHVGEGVEKCPFQLQLPADPIQTLPDTEIDIPIGIYNKSSKPIAVTLSCLSPKREWLTLDNPPPVPPQEWVEQPLNCRVPELAEARAGIYPFTLEVTSAHYTTARIRGTIEVLPTGSVEFTAFPKFLREPQTRPWLPQWRIPAAVYQLEFTNYSNLTQQETAEILKNRRSEDQEKREFSILPEQVNLEPGETQTLELFVNSKRPWVGFGKTEIIEVVGRSVSEDGGSGVGGMGGQKLPPLPPLPTPDSRLPTPSPASPASPEDPVEILELKLLPIIPRWLQVAIALLLLGGIWWLWYASFRLNTHTGPVNAVEFNGLGDLAISTSNDQTLRGWRVRGNKLQPTGLLGNLGKAGRTAHYRPLNNNRVAVGLENGEIQIWDLLERAEQPRRSLSYRRDDRVMALAYVGDSQLLFSAHGSGLLLQWYVGPNVGLVNVDEPRSLREFDFAIYDLAPVGPEQNTLAIAGRYNQLVLWDGSGDEEEAASGNLRAVPYQAGGQDEYITSLATAEEKPFFLATADDRGTISLWNLGTCLQQAGVPCQILEQWQAHDGRPIRSLALTSDGCYLASTGDDGQVMLWSLRRSGERSAQNLNGEAIVKSRSPLNSVDLMAVESDLLILTGGDNTRVRLHRLRRPESGCGM